MLAALALLASSSLVSANLLVNGDFEDHAAKYCNISWCILSDNRAIAPWYLSSGKGFEVDIGPWKAFSGNWSIDLNSDHPYSIAQNVTLIPGNKYDLQFQLRENGCGTYNKTGFVNATGGLTHTFYHNANQSNGVANWIPIKYSFTATKINTKIEIGSTTLGTCGPVIDQVTLNHVSIASSPNTSKTATAQKKKCVKKPISKK